MNEELKQRILKGPILPDEVPKEQYDNVIRYLISCGFIDSILKQAKNED